MSNARPAYRPMRYGRTLDPPPPSGLPDAWTRTHLQVRRCGQRACHEVAEETRYGYVTRCGVLLWKESAMRTARRQWCGHGCGEKRERAGTVDIPSGPHDSVDRQKNTRPDGTGNTVRTTAESDQPQTVQTDRVTSDDAYAPRSEVATAGPDTGHTTSSGLASGP